MWWISVLIDLVIALAFQGVIIWILLYCSDTTAFWKDENDCPRLRMPSLDDIEEAFKKEFEWYKQIEYAKSKEGIEKNNKRQDEYYDMIIKKYESDEDFDLETVLKDRELSKQPPTYTVGWKINDYVKKAIIPAVGYFNLRNKLEYYQEREDCEPMIMTVIWGGCLTFVTVLYFLLRELRGAPTIYVVFGLVIIAALSLTELYVLKRMYKKSKWKLSPCNHTLSELKARFIYPDTNDLFNTTQEAALNNYIINIHYNYLLRIEASIAFRYHLSKFLSFAIFVATVLLVGAGTS